MVASKAEELRQAAALAHLGSMQDWVAVKALNLNYHNMGIWGAAFTVFKLPECR